MSELVITVATRNSHKTREIQEILGPDFVVRDLSEISNAPNVEETGSTFEENAILKAVTVSKSVAGIVLADDSGLEVEALHGAPGVFSARYAGEPSNDRANVQKLLRKLAREPNRRARFRCVIAVAKNGALLRTFSGSVEGTIATVPAGGGGFGYDPVFVPTGFKETFAQLSPPTKNQFSHRARALEIARPFLREAA